MSKQSASLVAFVEVIPQTNLDAVCKAVKQIAPSGLFFAR
jgi:hypothetical protein